MVLEPSTGGDAQLQSAGLLVEQYKVRSGKAWALADLLKGVLRDLRRAVPEALPERAVYRFVTTGHPGRDVAKLLACFDRLRLLKSPDQIDDTEASMYDGDPLTDAAVFQRVCEWSRSSPAADLSAETHRVFHLVTNFEVDWEHKEEKILARIDDLLANVFYPPDIESARTNLLGRLLPLLSKKEVRLQRSEVLALFSRAGLDPSLPAKLAALAETLGAIAQDQIAADGYLRSRDVRAVVEWPADRPVLVITGETGAGKSWRLARLVHDLSARRELVTWSSAVGSVEEQLRQIGELVWNSGLQQHGERRIAALQLQYREWTSKTGYWLTATVDDVRNADLACQLVQRQEWSLDGVRLAISAPLEIAADLRARFQSRVHVMKVEDFEVIELDSYLKAHDRRWAELPDDLKQLLKKPILAKLYAELPHSSFAPRNEYEIFSAYWERMRVRAGPDSAGFLLALASRVLDRSEYPVPRSQWTTFGVDVAVIDRIIGQGWLRRTEADELLFSHDRLLNWAVAVEVARRVRSGSLPVAELAEFMLTCLGDLRAFQRPLGYVTMDVFWLIANKPVPGLDLGALLRRIEDDHRLSSNLYEDMLPTLGEPAISWLISRLKDVFSFHDARTVYQRSGLEKIAAQRDVDMGPGIVVLLDSGVVELQRIGLQLIARQPRRDYLDALWLLRGLHDLSGPEAYLNAPAWAKAMRACAALDLEWLIARIKARGTTPANLSDLAYVIAGIETNDAVRLWAEVREELAARIPLSKSRGVLYCIRRFSDTRYVDYCQARLNEPADWVDVAALSALSRIAPDRAIEYLSGAAEHDVIHSSSNWLWELLERRPQELRDCVLQMARRASAVESTLRVLFDSCPDAMGSDLLTIYLDELEAELVRRATSPDGSKDDWLYKPLALVSRIHHPESLALLRRRQGSALEQMLEEAGIRRIGQSHGVVDGVLEGARLTLLRIAGESIRNLILAELGSDAYWGRHGGLLWAEVVGSAAAGRLRRIALKSLDSSDHQSQSHQEAYFAFTKLAAIGADRDLVELIWQAGTECLSHDLPGLRGPNPIEPLLLESTRHALTAMETGDGQLERAFAVAWLSADATLLPDIRARLPSLDVESRTAALAFHALFSLQDTSEECQAFGLRLLAREKSRWMGVNLLATFGERGLTHLKAHLEGRAPEKWDHLDHDIIEHLNGYDSTRQFAADSAAMSLSRRFRWLDTPSFEIAAGSSVSGTQDRIFEAAFAADRTVVGRAVEAARATRHFDPERALEAARLELAATVKTADSICRIAVDVAGDEAIEWLVAAAKSMPEDRLPAIGRALRRIPAGRLTPALEMLLTESDARVRRIGALLAGWCGQPAETRLTSLLNSDPEGLVREASIDALRRRRRLAVCRDLLHSVPAEDGYSRWALLHAVIVATPAGLLTDRHDELWLGHALNSLPESFVHFAQEQLRKKGDRKEEGS